MTDEEMKIAEAFKQCADARLPDDFADRLVSRLRKQKESEQRNTPLTTVVVRTFLVAASLTLLLGFIPVVMERSQDCHADAVVAVDEIRPLPKSESQDGQLNTLALLGLCREAIRQRIRLIFERCNKREEKTNCR